MNPVLILRNSNCWESFKSHLGPLSNKQKGDAFELLTKYYLRLHPTHATQLEHIWLLSDVPQNIHKHLNLPHSDEGIDLVAETKDRTYWAIQCKYKEDETRSVTRKELSTFTDLAFNICQNIELGLVCSNADRVSHKLKMHGDRISFCAGDAWSSLDEEFFKRIHEDIKGNTIPIQKYSPRKHQQRAIKNAYRHFVEDGKSRGKLIMPCGTGKSLAGYWIVEKLEANKILIAVPSLSLIKQTIEIWARESVANKQEIHWIAICSDKSVSDIENDDITLLTQDLGIKVHTNPNVVSEWLKKNRPGKTVVISTYQSGKTLAEASRKSNIIFDLCLMDEAHKTTGQRDSLFSHLLFDENIKIKRRIFMTATERRYKGQSDEIISMEDPDIYGDTFELLTFKEALSINPPILCDYRIVTIAVSRSDITELIEKNVFTKPDRGKWNKEVEAETLASLVALRKVISLYPIKKAVSFHKSISRARSFKDNQNIFNSETFPEYGQLETFHVAGKTPTSLRAKEMKAFSNSKIGLITNARCLTEGVDIPSIDCILFADPKKGTVDIVQAVGRALRPHKEKDFGYVVVPVMVDGDAKEIEGLEDSMYQTIVAVLKALAADDERIVEYFKLVSNGRRFTKGEGPLDIHLPDGLAIDFEKFTEAIELKLWDKLAKLSWRPFEEAREYTRGLKLKGSSDWNKYCGGEMPEKGERPKDIPSNPQTSYFKEWTHWGDWLGTGKKPGHKGMLGVKQVKNALPFVEVREFVHSLNLETHEMWIQYSAGKMPEKGIKPKNIPSNPDRYYKDKGWKSWQEFLGNDYISFEEAREYARGLKLKGSSDWKKYSQGKMSEKDELPKNIPRSPNGFYADEWLGWNDWLGSDYLNFLPFEEAREFVRSLNLKGTEWWAYCRGELPEKGLKPCTIPQKPDRSYKDKGWIDWKDWLNEIKTSKSKHESWRPFEEARKFVRVLELQGQREWNQYCQGKMHEKGKKPRDIPSNPNSIYADDYTTLTDWLGMPKVRWRPFEEAREFARSLKLKASSDWIKYSQGKIPEKGVRPRDIPSSPKLIYGDEYTTMADWLGIPS